MADEDFERLARGSLLMAADNLGIDVIVSPVLPIVPSPGEDARRIVRHGLAEVVRWIGEEVGPKPGAPTEALMIDGRMHVSAAFLPRLKSAIEGTDRDV